MNNIYLGKLFLGAYWESSVRDHTAVVLAKNMGVLHHVKNEKEAICLILKQIPIECQVYATTNLERED